MRRQIRAQHKFPTIKYSPRVSHFDPKSDHRDFRGFFVLFWIGLAIMVITTMLRNIIETGYPVQFRQWDLFTENFWELGLSDLAMVISTALSLPLQKLYMTGDVLRWSKGGMAMQSLFQAIWLSFWVYWPYLRNWTWTAHVYFVLHLLVLFMKIHSYAFYNGHLSETRRRLYALDTLETDPKAAAARHHSTRRRLQEIMQGDEAEKESSDMESVSQVREDLALRLTSSLGQVTYPQNLTLPNYVDFLFCPTLCYELEYPRTPGTQWLELFYKTLAVFGCVFLLTVTSEEFIMPVLDEAAIRLPGSSLSDGGLILAETISRLLFPFMVSFLLVFLVIFEYVLNAFAEITCEFTMLAWPVL